MTLSRVTKLYTEEKAMKHFEELYARSLTGSIHGWDRISWRGTIRWLSSTRGLGSYLSTRHILLKDFKDWAMDMTDKVRESCAALAEIWGVRQVYLPSPSVNKEELAKRIAREDGIRSGPICLLSVVEPCWSPTVTPNRGTRKLEIGIRPRKCVWIYVYALDEEVGFSHLRLQSWLPFGIKGNFNGRHWLERQMQRAGIGYIKDGNCFRWIEQPGKAQEFLSGQLAADWRGMLESRRQSCFGVVDGLFEAPLEYYWSADETEWASDLMFRSTSELDRLFPMLARYGLSIADSPNVLRFLGTIDAEARLPARVSGDVRGDRRRRYEGVRVKHWYGRNSVKVYNKAGSVLRVETGINDTRSFKVFRQANDDESQPARWQPMRKGVADLHRRAEISQKSNERCLDALSACNTQATLIEQLQGICARTRLRGRSVRALNPWNPLDFQLLGFLAHGEWCLGGLRNRDLAAALEPGLEQLGPDERRRLTARVSRHLSLLRAHGLIKKIARTHRYQLTSRGQEIATLVRAASSVCTEQLMNIAA